MSFLITTNERKIVQPQGDQHERWLKRPRFEDRFEQRQAFQQVKS